MLEIHGLTKVFHPGTPNEVRAIEDVNLTIEEGGFVIIVGTNGSGKSTLLNAVAGTFPVDLGAIWLDGAEISSWPEHRRAKLMGRVFQNPFSGTSPNLTIAENLVLAARRGLTHGLGSALNSRTREELRARVRQLNMGLEDRLENAIGTLSGGERQALTLLMGTWLRPKLLLLDEHTAALDPKSADQVIAITELVVTRDHLTTLMVTHSMQQAAKLGDQLVMMHRGKIIREFKGAEKQRIQVGDLLARFEDVRRADLLDESAAKMLERNYV